MLDYKGNNTYVTNASPEVDAETGVFIFDPLGRYNHSAKSTTENNFIYITSAYDTWNNSGVINYLNLLGYRHGNTEIKWNIAFLKMPKERSF